MSEIAKATCRVHPERPASFRCRGCGGFFCAECVTEHENRYTCANCLAEQGRKAEETPKGRRWFRPAPLVQFAIAVAVSWLIFYLVAQFLLGIPDQFHDGTVWE